MAEPMKNITISRRQLQRPATCARESTEANLARSATGSAIARREAASAARIEEWSRKRLAKLGETECPK